jgi:hypothetical protein
MKRRFIVLTLLVALSTVTFSQTKSTSGILGGVKDVLSKTKNSKGSSLSTEEIVSGLKEALSQGANNSTSKVSAADGFFRDAAIKILLPQQVQKVEKKMRMLGMGKLVDNAELSMNRAAEDASKSAAPIFLDAIKKMSFSDALNILKGSDTAATGYLRKTTSNPLTDAFRPVIETSLAKTDATKYWKDVFSVYNKFSSEPVDTDINSYVTSKALYGIFFYVGEEEKKIRKDPAARATDILKKVFGSQAK